MLSRVSTFALDGLESRLVVVEVDLRPGLPAFTVVGLADRSVREARDRVHSALLNCGFKFPQDHVTVNLAPAHLRKVGAGFDLAIACGVLAAGDQVPQQPLGELAVFGELGLDGEVRPCRGTLAVAEGALRAGFRGLIVPWERAREASFVDGLEVIGVRTLTDVAEVLRGGDAPPPQAQPPEPSPDPGSGLDLCDVRGHDIPIRALTIAAAGGHNLLLSGPPGTGKTMLARRLPTILPPLERGEAIEVTRIHSVTGLLNGDGLVTQRPFRAPHHTISASGLVGGGAVPRAGEASLAHRGVLFLDELSEFSRPALEALRQPLEDGRVAIVRGQHAVVFPTRAMLVAATNPCPCGFAGSARCRCSELDHARHRRRLSGPLLDRLDLLVSCDPPSPGDLQREGAERSDTVRAAVGEARARQKARLAGTAAACNAELNTAQLRRAASLSDSAQELLARSYAAGGLSARGHARTIRVARTIADLAGSEGITREHMLEALALRQDVGGVREASAA